MYLDDVTVTLLLSIGALLSDWNLIGVPASFIMIETLGRLSIK